MLDNLEGRVVHCYDFVGRFLEITLSDEARPPDLTEGHFGANSEHSYAQAQYQKVEYLLDAVGCTRGSRLLDIGCGHGGLLQQAKSRGAQATGITISPRQVAYCQQRDLDAMLLNYRDVPLEQPDWHQSFDCVVASGSMEHFVDHEIVAEGKQDERYQELFEIVHQLLNPQSSSRRFVSTCIHLSPAVTVNPLDLAQVPSKYARGSILHHFSSLQWVMGGYYPATGQFERCAKPWFRLLDEVDHTENYRLTSEYWVESVWQAVRKPRMLSRLLWNTVPYMVRHPLRAKRAIECFLGTESWTWQFRPGFNQTEPTARPTQLLYHTWQHQ